MSTIDFILKTLQQGKCVAVTDHAERENEADLILPATHITVEQTAFLIRHTSGIICVAMKKERLQQLGLERIQTNNPGNFDTPFTLPVDLKAQTRGGVSAAERTATIRALVNPATQPEEFGKPGHVFPLEAHEGGVRARPGHTEAGVELMQLAGLYPAAVIAELMNDDGTMMRGDELQAFVQQHNIPLCSIDDIQTAVQSYTQ